MFFRLIVVLVSVFMDHHLTVWEDSLIGCICSMRLTARIDMWLGFGVVNACLLVWGLFRIDRRVE